MHDDLEWSGRYLTSDQGQVMTKVGHVAYQSMRRDETNTMKRSLALFNCEFLVKTVGDLRSPR